MAEYLLVPGDPDRDPRALCAVYANRCTNQFKQGAGEENARKIAKEAVRILCKWDNQKRKKKKQWLFPSLLAA